MKKAEFGYTPDGGASHLYEIRSDGATVRITDFGAAVVSFITYGRDIVGGYDTLDGYLVDDSHQGATVGRVANRIADARFTVDGKEYLLPRNDGGNCLHGGNGLDRRIWTVTEHTDSEITLEYESLDGDEGFPGRLLTKVKFSLSGCALRIDYSAVADKRTPIALTNHSYFNLDGLGGDILGHRVAIHADRYTDVDAALIPNGERPEVEGTPFDLRQARLLGDIIGKELDGFDHNFILCRDITHKFDKKSLHLAAEACSGELGLEVWTDQPGVQFYTGNFLGDGPDFKGGCPQVKHGAFCLETQTEPNCINRGEAIYDAGEEYTHTTVYLVKNTAVSS